MKWYYFLQDALGVLVAYGSIRLMILCIKYIIYYKAADMFVFLKGASAVSALLSGVWLIANKWSGHTWLIFLIISAISYVLLISANKIKKGVDMNETGKC